MIRSLRVTPLVLLLLQAGDGQSPGFPPGGPPNPVVWYLSGVRFSDGGTASGSFVFDANNWQFSAIDITTTAGSSAPGAHYTAWDPGNAIIEWGVLVVPTAGLADYTGLPLLELFSNYLFTNAGGTIPLTLGGASMETTCNMACNALFPTPVRTVVAGSLTTIPPGSVPVLPTWGLVLLGVLLLGYSVIEIRRRRWSAVPRP